MLPASNVLWRLRHNTAPTALHLHGSPAPQVQPSSSSHGDQGGSRTPSDAEADAAVLIHIDVGALAIPKVFGVAFNNHGTVIRVCDVAWRRGELIGASYLSAKQLRECQQRKAYIDPRLHKVPA
jgi:hypothetical protein